MAEAIVVTFCTQVGHVKSQHLYIKIGLLRCVTTGVAWMDGRSHAADTSGELRAEIDGLGGGGVAYEAHGYKQCWADEQAGRRASRQSKSSQNLRSVSPNRLVLRKMTLKGGVVGVT